ncbi:predicted protein [Naegleria gruberi]|uniref:Predicted protein n=1 Tax=Naegleria gruberi TaxID=5762 RepID=D2VU04_NAEGR|nr:uncharacterized protein NAEGRDRAFT_72492 [Naegleria gruberi]EFC39812.1 predicted protein [Naegleria gruberi]|eukprot:XP_002672556.1 predicted protein [Naegleria gruberi strain NEG-M]
MFGLVSPGRPCYANFNQVGENRWFIQIPDKVNGQSISELTIFALPNVGMPPLSHGFTIYISKDSNNWEFLDFLTIDKPSTHIHVPLSFDSSSSVQSAFQGINYNNNVDQLFVGISLEPIDTINNLTCNAVGKQQMEQSQVQQLVKAIANDLFNFMSSFTKPYQVNESGTMREMLVLPTNILDTWLQKFLNKLRLNPHCKYYETNIFQHLINSNCSLQTTKLM